MSHASETAARLYKDPCPRCGCHAVQKFKCNCGEKHSDYCDNCGLFRDEGHDASHYPPEHLILTEVDARCEHGNAMHEHPTDEKIARIDAHMTRLKAKRDQKQ